MREFHKKNTTKKILYSIPSVIILTILLFFVARGVYAVYLKENDSQVEVDRVQQQMGQLQSRYAAIQQDSDRLKSTDGVEAEIRTKFDVVKEGEGVIVVVDRNTPTIQEDKRGTLTRFWDSVIGIFGGSKKTDAVDAKSTGTGGVVQNSQ